MQRLPKAGVSSQCPAEFSFNMPQHICLEVSSNPENLDLLFQMCLIKIGAKRCSVVALQSKTGHPCPKGIK